MRDILIIGLIIAAVVILVRTTMGTPLIRRVMETFTVSVMNVTTECPDNSKMYMYDGAAFCCSSRINPDANSLADSCSAPGPGTPSVTFCSLGPGQKDVPNCLDIADSLLSAEGARFCPSSAPNYVKGPRGSATEKGRCCATLANATGTDCLAAAGSCDVSTAANLFTTTPTPTCQFLKAQIDDGVCPTKYSPMVFKVEHGPFSGLSLYGCFNPMKGGCLAPATLDRLKALKYDVAGIPVCS